MADPETDIVSAQQAISSSTKPPEETGIIADSADDAADQRQADVKMFYRKEYKLQSKSVTLKQDREAKTAQGFPFMKLPPEVRNMIYKEVLEDTSIINLIALGDTKKVREVRGKPVLLRYDPEMPPVTPYSQGQFDPLLLLRASKAIHDEAYPVYYGRNTFFCRGLAALRGFLGRLKREYRRSIRSLGFDMWGDPAAKSIRLLQGCVSLQDLHIDCRGVRLWDNLRSDSVLPGYNELLKLRGIRSLQILRPVKDDIYRLGSQTYRIILPADTHEYWEEIIEDLQVLKQPRSEAMVRRQDWKDFPLENTKRTVYGKANVQTRSERAIADQDRGKE
ncbi:MAG: hypothetical protein LQ349_009101 [Xanthoria aureola]|nr:MAG: hypothetical protein LQ349_009101 [Xanthoria aureola]